MWLFLLSLLAIKGIQSASIAYPYRSLWNSNPLKSGSIHDYLPYANENGAGGIVGYNNLQPIYAVRQIKYVNSDIPAQETYAINNSEEFIKARETYLRAASLHQYQSLKIDIDALRAEGKEPSAEKLLKLQMLEKIAFTSDFSLIADLPDVKSTLQDLESSVSRLHKESAENSINQQNHVTQNQGETKTYVGNSNIPLVAIEETPEQKQAHKDHLRIYNEQIAHLKQLELEHEKYVQETISKSNVSQLQKLDKELANEEALAGLERAQQDHFRLWNEAKLHAEQTGYTNGGVYETADMKQISTLKHEQNINKSKQNSLNIQHKETQNAKASAGDNKHFQEKGLKSIASSSSQVKAFNDQAKVKIVYQNPEQQHLVDTPDVVRAREEHLRIVNEAILKAQTIPKLETGQLQQQNIKSDSLVDKTKQYPESLNQHTASVQSQNLQGSSVEQYRAEQSFAEETPEVKKAREEHLRLVHEANLRAQFVEQQELKYKHESQIPILKSQYEHGQLVYHPASSQNVQETPEVAKAREEHLHLVKQAKLNALNEKPITNPSKPQEQQTAEAQGIEDTSEVQRAREEHLRVFNTIKSIVEQEQPKQNSRILPNPTSQQQSILDYSIEEERLLELERLREAERLQKEQQLLELERMREAERLAEEKRQMEAELIRLKLEDEHRLEMERLLEVKRFQQEQEELQKLKNSEYQEIIFQTDSKDQQPQIAIISNPNVEQARTEDIAKAIEQQSQQYINNPFLKINDAAIASTDQQTVSLPGSFLKTIPAQIPVNSYGPNSVVPNNALTSSDNTISSVRYIQSPHPSSGNKHQHIKNDNIKHNYLNAVSTQPADTAVALIALEKATNDHLRAHELALEQLRIARIQIPSVKDCN